MKKALFYSLVVLILSACFKPELEVKSFFTVSLDRVEPLDGTFGQVLLSGSLGGEGDLVGKVEDYGFLWSTDPQVLQQEPFPTGANIISRGAYSGDNRNFADESPFLEGDRTYYFAAYAKGEERMVISERIDSFSFRVQLDIDFPSGRINDTVDLELSVGNLNLLNIQIDTLRMRVATNAQFTNAAAITYLPLDADTRFTDRLTGLAFNTTYYLQLYFEAANGPYEGPVASIFIGDGWTRMADLPLAIQGAAGVVVGDMAYLLGGCLNESCGEVGDINRRIYQLDLSNPSIESATWVRSNGEIPIFNSFYLGIAADFKEDIYFGFGEVSRNNLANFFFKLFAGQTAFITSGEPPPRLRDAVAFSLNDRIYFGTGSDGQETTNQFWELRAGNPFDTLRPIARLPVRIGEQDVTTRGRENAVVLQVDGAIYVGSGIDGATLWTDFYRFVPPASASDTGSWEFFSRFPGVPRYGAAGMSAGGRAFFGLGFSPFGTYYQDWWEFLPGEAAGQRWVRRESFPGEGRRDAVSLFENGIGVVATGRTIEQNQISTTPKLLKDSWIYYPLQ